VRFPPRLDIALAAGLAVIGIVETLTSSDLSAKAGTIAAALTAKTHVGRVLMKLGLRDRVQAVIFAYEADVVAPGS
jgi:ATP/maltotriose-dependent transcriptional regulator MalT